jgi:HEAT repeat protein
MLEAQVKMKIMDALGAMHTAIKNVILYPPASPAIDNTMERLYFIFRDVLNQKAPFIIAESEKQLLVCGEPLEIKERESIQAVAILQILMKLDLKSISFNAGLEKKDLSVFIRYLSKSPDELKEDGGLGKIMEQKNILHIMLDEKKYVSMDKDQIITSEPAIDHEIPESQIAIDKEQLQQSIAGIEQEASRLADELLDKNTDIRSRAAARIVELIESLAPEQQNELVGSLSGGITQWLECETDITLSYQKIGNSLQKFLQRCILLERYDEALSPLGVLHKINTGQLQKDDAIRSISAAIIKNLASEDNLLILFKEYNTNAHNKQSDVNQILLDFDEAILDKTLDLIRDVSDSNERVRAIHLIIGIGKRAIPAITGRIHDNVPWYYLRNLAYVLGRIGDESSAWALKPLLLHQNDKVQMEALKSIFQIGAAQRGTLFLSVLDQVDTPFRLNIIEMLGKVKCSEAVSDLLKMLKKPPKMTPIEQTALQEKICAALDIIGSPEAIPTLSEIAEAKSFLGIRWYYTVELRHAAQRALESIKRKQKTARK